LLRTSLFHTRTDAIPKSIQSGVALSVGGAVGVLPAIDLDDQASVAACEVGKIGTD
jgi:hypothetical protein